MFRLSTGLLLLFNSICGLLCKLKTVRINKLNQIIDVCLTEEVGSFQLYGSSSLIQYLQEAAELSDMVLRRGWKVNHVVKISQSDLSSAQWQISHLFLSLKLQKHSFAQNVLSPTCTDHSGMWTLSCLDRARRFIFASTIIWRSALKTLCGLPICSTFVYKRKGVLITDDYGIKYRAIDAKPKVGILFGAK